MIADGYPPEFVEILREFVAEIPPMLDSLVALEGTKDMEKIGRVAHQIKGSAANFGFRGVSSAAAEIEMLAKRGSWENGSTLIAQAQRDFGISMDELRDKRGIEI